MSGIGQRVKEERERRGWSQARLAKKARDAGADRAGISVSQQSIDQIEKGTTRNPRSLNFIARALGVTPEWLQTGEGQREFDEFVVNQPTSRDAMVEVKSLDVRAAGGAGAVVDVEEENGRFGFPAREFDVPAERLRVITVIGDSMFLPGDPSSLQPGDRVVVDTAQKVPSPPGIFVLHNGMGLVVKRVEPLVKVKRVRIFSINPAYKEYELSASEAHIQGRVIGVWRRV
jgi:phage repressor protein C with HTH and peptisase S24 domain